MGSPRYESGDRVWVKGGSGGWLPGVVIGHHQTWDLYRVAYMVDVAGRGPRAIEEWRLSARQRDEPPGVEDQDASRRGGPT